MSGSREELLRKAAEAFESMPESSREIFRDAWTPVMNPGEKICIADMGGKPRKMKKIANTGSRGEEKMKIEMIYREYDAGYPCTESGYPFSAEHVPVGIKVDGVILYLKGYESGDLLDEDMLNKMYALQGKLRPLIENEEGIFEGFAGAERKHVT